MGGDGRRPFEKYHISWSSQLWADSVKKEEVENEVEEYNKSEEKSEK